MALFSQGVIAYYSFEISAVSRREDERIWWAMEQRFCPLINEQKDTLRSPGVLRRTDEPTSVEQVHKLFFGIVIHISVVETIKPVANSLESVLVLVEHRYKRQYKKEPVQKAIR